LSTPAERVWALDAPFDLDATVRPLSSGFGDPTRRVAIGRWLQATRTADGPATLEVEHVTGDRLRMRGYGPGAEAVVAGAPQALGLDRPPPEAATDAGARLARRARGVRLARVANVFEPLVLLVLQQKVSGKEAARAHRELIRAISEPAPGPAERVRGLWLPPAPAALRRLPGWAAAPLGILPRQAETLRRVAFQAERIARAAALPPEEALPRLLSVPGVGPWTATSLLLHARGAADVVPIGDLHLPRLVAFALTGEARADDRRMLELLAPFRGQRGWVVRWISAACHPPPRRHPRRPLRPLPPGGRELAIARLRRG
jgi:3-methyladenine DNA glycosylase/8-oxoguanine DNA glycosylase